MPLDNRNGGGKRNLTPYKHGLPELQTFFPDENHVQLASRQHWEGMIDNENRLFAKGPNTGVGFMKAMEDNINTSTHKLKADHKEVPPGAKATLIETAKWLQDIVGARFVDNAKAMTDEFEKKYNGRGWKWAYTDNPYKGTSNHVLDLEQTLSDYRTDVAHQTPKATASINKMEADFNDWYKDPTKTGPVDKAKKQALSHHGVLQAATAAHNSILTECS